MTSSPPPVRALLVDWAGTIIDHGSRAPVRAVIEVFRAAGIAIDEPEARAPMGMAKRDHLRAILAMPRVAADWESRRGLPPRDEDADALYEAFLPLQRRLLAEHCDPIPGAAETFTFCRERGIAIGSTTGYTRELMEVVTPRAAAAGLSPDVIVCSDEVSAGRPAPWSLFRAAEAIGVYPPAAVLVVDDTPAGIAAARNAGMRGIGVTRTGNGLGLSAAEVALLAADERQRREDAVAAELRAAGAEDCVPGIGEVPRWLRERGLAEEDSLVMSARVALRSPGAPERQA